MNNHRLSDVLIAIDLRHTLRLRRANIAAPRPLPDRVSRDTSELPGLPSQIVPSGRKLDEISHSVQFNMVAVRPVATHAAGTGARLLARAIPRASRATTRGDSG